MRIGRAPATPRWTDALYERAVLEGRQEFRIQVGEQEGYSWPGVTEAGELDLSIIRDILPHQYYIR